MAIDPKDVYIGMKIVRNPENYYEEFTADKVLTVTGWNKWGNMTVKGYGSDGFNPDFMDAYAEPAETFAGFKVGDRVRRFQCISHGLSGIAGGHPEVVTGFDTREMFKGWVITESGNMNDPANLELVTKASETPSQPFVLTIGTLTFDSLESLSQAISEGVVTIAQVKTIRVKDGWVSLEDKVWWHGEYGPEEVLVDNDMFNIRVYPELYSIKKPEWIPAKDGYYSGEYES